MKGKIILAFVFALLALTLIGFVGQNTLTQLIISIKKDSEPNQKIAALDDIMNDLSYAENSVRTYTITREPESLTPFYESISTIDNKIIGLYDLVKSKEQLKLVDSMQSLIEQKYSILKQLIDIKKDQDAEEVLERVLENIARLRAKDSIPELITNERTTSDETNYDDRIRKVEIPEPTHTKKPSIFQRIFGGGNNNDHEDPEANKLTHEDEDFASTDDPVDSVKEEEAPAIVYIPPSGNDLNSNDIGHIISKIGQERSENIKATREQELALTVQDNDLMEQIKKVAHRFEEREKKASLTRAQTAEKATQRATDFISITWVVALVIFAILLFIIFNDISRNQKNREQLKFSKERAEKLAKVKEEFLSNMSHEIRTPLNSIIGYTEQLEGTTLTSEQKKFLKSIHYSGDHLLRIINDILDYAKLESGKLSLESICFPIAQNITEVIDSFQNDIEKKNLQVKVQLDEALPQVVIGDPVRFRQILINLLSNAIKFTPKGTIEISGQPQQLEDGHVLLRIAVRDSGIGIPKGKLNSIFRDFAQVDSSTTRKYGGTGLGLSIVKKIVDLHQGEISVESDEGKGTTFTVDLNYQVGRIEDLKQPAKTVPVSYDQLEGKKILVVDDQEYNLELIKVIFDKWKINGTLLGSGKEAIRALKKAKFDVVLMDVQMPEMSGLEATQKIRVMEKDGAHTQIIALTAAASKDEATRCLKSGMDGYLLKPFTQNELYMKLTEALGITDIPVTDDNGSRNGTTIARIINIDDLQRLAAGDPSFVVNMLSIFIKNFDIDLKDLLAGLHDKNWHTLRAKSHKMIPPCRHLGLDQLVTMLKEVEIEAEEGHDYIKVKKLVNEINSIHNDIRPFIMEEISRLQKGLSESVA